MTACCVVFCLALSLVACDDTSSFAEEGDYVGEVLNNSIEGTWVQQFEGVGSIGEIVVTFDSGGQGSIWSYLVNAEGLTQVYFFSYSLDGTSTVTLHHEEGGSDVLSATEWSQDEILITAEGDSDWFTDCACFYSNMLPLQKLH